MLSRAKNRNYNEYINQSSAANLTVAGRTSTGRLWARQLTAAFYIPSYSGSLMIFMWLHVKHSNQALGTYKLYRTITSPCNVTQVAQHFWGKKSKLSN